MRKQKKWWSLKYLPLLMILGIVSWDVSTGLKNGSQDGTFRYEWEFEDVSYGNTQISIVPSDYEGLSAQVPRNVNPEYSHIEEMVRKAIDLQGGLEGVIEKGDQVMLKINLIGGNSPSGEGENTDVRVVKALIKIIDEFTEGDVDLVVAEGTARNNDDPNEDGSVWHNSGYVDMMNDPYLEGINFRLLNLNQSIDDMVEIDLGKEATSAVQGTKYSIHQEQVNSDVFIAVPVLKIHNTGITNALKLQVGVAPGCVYGYNKMAGTTHSKGIVHDEGHRRWTTEAIVDLCNVTKVDFVVTDAIMCLEEYKSYNGNNQVRFNTIMAGRDPVAMDHVATKMMGLNPDDIAHITLAEKMGLGTNNADNIEITGADIEDVKKRVEKNQSENGKFGQSNRSWILSKAFDGTDIETEYIENEATVEPVAGKDGWVGPVYFFDDRIDLLNFYNRANDIVSYAFTHVNSPDEQTAELWLGTHEAIYVYLNEELVYSSSRTQTYGDDDIGSKVATIDLKEGENKLLVKTLNRYGDYSFALNICEVESDSRYLGNRVPGLKFVQKSQSTGFLEAEYAGKEDVNLLAYPNPCSQFVNFSFDNPKAGNVKVEILDMRGSVVKVLKDEMLPQGRQIIDWEPGDTWNPGVYLCRVQLGSVQKVIRIQIH